MREKGRPKVTGVRYHGAGSAILSPAAAGAISKADRVVICPANPVSSIGPILSVPGVVPLLKESKGRVVGLSPMAGKAPYTGPAGKFMRATGSTPDSLGVAKLYSKFLDCLLIAEEDSPLSPSIEALGIECKPTDTRLGTPGDELRLAKELVRA